MSRSRYFFALTLSPTTSYARQLIHDLVDVLAVRLLQKFFIERNRSLIRRLFSSGITVLAHLHFEVGQPLAYSLIFPRVGYRTVHLLIRGDDIVAAGRRHAHFR